MKKWLAMMLVVAIAFVFAGCKKDPIVETVAVESVVVTAKDNNTNLKVGQTVQLSTEVKPTNATDKTVTYVSSKTEVASVSDSGLVTAKAAGEATITATAGGKKGTIIIKVAVVESELEITDAPTGEVEVGYEFTLKANKAVTWDPDTKPVATVDAAGKVKAVAVGTAKIKATAGSQVKEITVTVKAKFEGLAITGAPVGEVEVGSDLVLTANKTVDWNTSNAEVATVDATGKVTFLKAGEVVITATAGEESKSVTITVKAVVVVDLEVTGIPTNDIKVGDKVTLLANKVVTWVSSDESIATVVDGLVTFVGEGSVTITVTAGEEVKTIVIEVLPYVMTITSPEGKREVMVDSKLQLTASEETVIWSSSDVAVAIVDEATGLVTGVSAGTVTITAEAGD